MPAAMHIYRQRACNHLLYTKAQDIGQAVVLSLFK